MVMIAFYWAHYEPCILRSKSWLIFLPKVKHQEMLSLGKNLLKLRKKSLLLNQGSQGYKDKWQKAIGFYSETIKLSSNNATYDSNRSQAYLELGSYLQAEADCTKAINLDKKNVKVYFRRGRAREMLGYYTDALDDFQHALVLELTNKMASSAAERLRKLFQ
ncbi:hypothetical protein HN51_008859 [Arachis hypogaea]|uniref:Uncharacterized protein n=1 Tax=Arachis hypogaea TaxID=3818 RepID=A0A445D1R6_ARAHY|nr:uncharacterized protein LOC112802326 [Arachis hypogaea]XP_029154314.1 uncharacterized protein LOC112802326 [Arachis hypogaea]RYR57121.1 hypothetical protein Ahy_A05g022852 isoform A [Arachis hypogaea]